MFTGKPRTVKTPFPPLYGGANNFPLRGSKTTEFEGGIRINAFVSGGIIPQEMRGERLGDDHGYMHISDWCATSRPTLADECLAFALSAGLSELSQFIARPAHAGTTLSPPSRAEMAEKAQTSWPSVGARVATTSRTTRRTTRTRLTFPSRTATSCSPTPKTSGRSSAGKARSRSARSCTSRGRA